MATPGLKYLYLVEQLLYSKKNWIFVNFFSDEGKQVNMPREESNLSAELEGLDVADDISRLCTDVATPF